MVRPRAPSTGSALSMSTTASTTAPTVSSTASEQELGTMYDYLAKIILLGPSGSGKSCLLHRFVRHEWRVLSSQTIGVEFSSRIVKVGTGATRKRVKLQLWDTAGQERFRSVTRSYYRGAAGALLVYDITSHRSFAGLPTFLSDARQLAGPGLTVVLVGNKSDLQRAPPPGRAAPVYSSTPESTRSSSAGSQSSSLASTPTRFHDSTAAWASEIPESIDAEPARAVAAVEAARWAGLSGIPVSMETSALSGDNVDEVFQRMARMIVTKIELGEVDPDDPTSGIQYGDRGAWTGDSGGGGAGGGGRRGRKDVGGWKQSLREWETVFRRDAQRRGGKCC